MSTYTRLLPAFLLALVLGVSTIWAAPAGAFQGAGCAGDCRDCHTLDIKEAGTLLKADKLKIEVKEIREAPIKGLWEVVVEQEGRSSVIFVDFSKNYLVEINRIIPLERLAERPKLKKVDLGQIPLENALLIGDAKAKHKIIVFDDPECPYCVKLHAEIKKIVEKRKDVAFYIKLFPLPMHPGAYDKSRTIVCKKDAKLLDDAFEGKALPKPDCDSKEVDANIALAEDLGIRGTPALIYPDGRLVPGYLPSDAILDLLDNPE